MYEAYEECMEELEASIPAYVEKIGEFQHENQTCRVVDYYKLEHGYAKCVVCGKPNIVHVFVIQNVETKKKMTVGNECIDNITNEEVGAYYKNYSRHKTNLIKNKDIIQNVDAILTGFRRRILPCWIEWKHVVRFETMLERLCKGLNLTESQRELHDLYYKKIRRKLP